MTDILLALGACLGYGLAACAIFSATGWALDRIGRAWHNWRTP